MKGIQLSNTFKVVAGVMLVAIVIVVGWFAYWEIAEQSQTNRYKVNTRSQQYQSATVAQLRNYVTAYNVAVDDSQKAQIAETFCTMYVTLEPAPADLAFAYPTICSGE
jgi:Tfp pilus assembly protein PilO